MDDKGSSVETVVSGNFSNKQTTFCEVDMEPGATYLVFAEVNSSGNSKLNSVSVYSEAPVSLEDVVSRPGFSLEKDVQTEDIPKLLVTKYVLAHPSAWELN